MELPVNAKARHKEQGQLAVKCHRIYRAEDSINILLSPSEAVLVASNLMKKVQLLVEEGLADTWTIQLWSVGNDRLKFGLHPAKKSHRKPKRKVSV